MNIKPTNWNGCYDGTWRGTIVEKAWGHPAKYGRELIRMIYKHALVNGWLKRGDTVIDPFGGVALGALDAMLCGCNWVGCELEEQWAKVGNDNILTWQRHYSAFNLGQAVLLNGDSRKLAQMVKEGSTLAVTSPPYINSIRNQKDGIDWEKAKQNGEDGGNHDRGASCNADIGKSDGQLAAMPEGEFDAAIASPPFIQRSGGGKGINVKGYTGKAGRTNKSENLVGKRSYQAERGDRANSNLEILPEGDFTLAVSSPPYETIATGAGGLNTKPAKKPGQQSGRNAKAASQDTDQRYGSAKGQLAKLKQGDMGSGDTFWLASRTIVEQVFLLLKPGGHAIWVTKNFVRDKKEVDFNGRWQALCEAMGFKTVCIHLAMQVEQIGTNLLLEGGEHTRTKTKKSFFRRNAEKRGSPPIDFECVTCMMKP